MDEPMKGEIENRASKSGFRITSIVIATAMLVGMFGIFVGPFTVNVSAQADNTWIADGSSSASVAESWENGTLTSGQNIWFTSAHVGACSWNVADTFGDWKMRTGYTGTVTQAASFSITSYSQAAGTFTGSMSYLLTDSGNFAYTGGSISPDVLQLRMTGDGTTCTIPTQMLLVQASANVTLTSALAEPLIRGITVDAGCTLTISATIPFSTTYSQWVFSNAGIIAGVNGGALRFNVRAAATPSIIFGTITCPVLVTCDVSSTGNAIANLGATSVLASNLTVKSNHATYTMTLNHGTNYELTVAGAVVLSTRGIMTQGTGTWTFGNYTQSGASSVFTQGGNVFVNGDTSISQGTLTGSASTWWVNSGSFTQSGTGTITTSVLNLALEGSGTISLISAGNFRSLAINGTYTNLAADNLLTTFDTYGTYVAYSCLAGTLVTDTVVIFGVPASTSNLVMSGTQTGAGSVCILTQASLNLPAISSTIANLSFALSSVSSLSRTLTMTGDISNTGNVAVQSAYGSNTLTIAHGTNYRLTVTGALTLGIRGIMTQGTGTWTFGNYTQSGASSVFTQGGNVFVNGASTISTGTLTGNPSYAWTQNGDFTVGNGATVTSSALRLVMNLTDSTVNMAVGMLLKSLTLNANTVFASNFTLGNATVWMGTVALTCQSNFDTSNSTFYQNTSTVHLNSASSYAKLDSAQQFHNLTVNSTGVRLIVNTTDLMKIAGNLTINSGCSVSLQNHSYVLNQVANGGAIIQNGKRLNITGSSSAPLTGYGAFDGDLYLNGSVASSYEIQTSLPMGYLHTDRDTKISISPSRYLRVTPATNEFVDVTINSYGTETGYDARWAVTSSVPTTYTVVVAPDQLYEVWVDQTYLIGVRHADSDGAIQFDYPGPFSTHTFTVQDVRSLPCKLWASFTYSVDGLKVEFIDTTYAQPTMRIWNFGDGWGSTNSFPTHKYGRSGTYQVVLIVFDEYGHTSTATTTIAVDLGPTTPMERTEAGWRFYLGNDTVISVSAVGLAISGAISLVSVYLFPDVPFVTKKARKLYGVLAILAGVYFVVFVKGVMDIGGIG